MDLKTRSSLPKTPENGGLNVKSFTEFFKFEDILEQLKKCCLFGASGVLSAFSNSQLRFSVQLTSGKINTINLPEQISNQDLTIIGSPKYAAIQGNIHKHECVFPHFQYTDDKQINISCSAFENCPHSFKPDYHGELYLSFNSDDYAVQLLQKSLWEFSQNNSNMAIILLFCSIEVAVEQLTGKTNGKISVRLRKYSKLINSTDRNLAITITSIKKRIEKHIVTKRGDVAHKGKLITQNDLLKSYETALEFFWYYPEYKRISAAL